MKKVILNSYAKVNLFLKVGKKFKKSKLHNIQSLVFLISLNDKIVIDWKQQSKNQNLEPRVEIHNKKANGEVLILENGSPARYDLTVDSIISITNQKPVKEGDVIARVPKESSKTNRLG